MRKNTDQLFERLQQTEDIAAFISENKEILDSSKFVPYLKELLEKYGVKIACLIEETDYSKTMLYAIAKGTRNPGKDVVIQIGIAIGVTLPELQRMLKLSHNEELYVKDKRDSIIIYGIQKGKDLYEIDELLAQYRLKPLLK